MYQLLKVSNILNCTLARCFKRYTTWDTSMFGRHMRIANAQIRLWMFAHNQYLRSARTRRQIFSCHGLYENKWHCTLKFILCVCDTGKTEQLNVVWCTKRPSGHVTFIQRRLVASTLRQHCCFDVEATLYKSHAPVGSILTSFRLFLACIRVLLRYSRPSKNHGGRTDRQVGRNPITSLFYIPDL